ncbi:MAG: hypothetical protein AB1589_13875 [Cyanobacteriota bacterium]
MVKFIALLLGLALSFAIASPAEASFCRNSDHHSICILSIKRSAKNYWEYRASVRVDGVERPIEVYNCRDRIRIRQDGTVVPFESDGSGELICKFFQK